MDIDIVRIVDSHRLPQHPLFKLGKRVTRPIIVKLAYVKDKTAIYKATNNLNKYNRTRRELKQSTPNVFITDHLPRAFQEQRKKSIPYFNIKLELTIEKQNSKLKTENTVCLLTQKSQPILVCYLLPNCYKMQ